MINNMDDKLNNWGASKPPKSDLRKTYLFFVFFVFALTLANMIGFLWHIESQSFINNTIISIALLLGLLFMATPKYRYNEYIFMLFAVFELYIIVVL